MKHDRKPLAAMAARADIQIVLLPGLGADGRLFAAQREVFPDLHTPAWGPPFPDETLAQHAARLAAEIPTGRPLLLGGYPFGGMVASEMARTLRPDTLVLIGTNRADEVLYAAPPLRPGHMLR